MKDWEKNNTALLSGINMSSMSDKYKKCLISAKADIEISFLKSYNDIMENSKYSKTLEELAKKKLLCL